MMTADSEHAPRPHGARGPVSIGPPQTDRVPGVLAAAQPAAVILTGLLAGAVLATWVVEASLVSSAELWIDYHQATTAAYTRALPPIGALGLVGVVALFAAWRDVRARPSRAIP